MPAAPFSTVMSGNDLTVGLRNTFMDAYRNGVNEHPLLKDCMDLALPTDGRYEIYAYPKSAPYPERWRQGDGIPTSGFDYVQFTVPNIRFGRRIAWAVDDREDGKTGTLYDQANSAGGHFATLVERMFFEYVKQSASLLPGLQNAPDGLALWSGSTRFGVSTGNVVSGGGVASGDAVRTDVFKAVTRMALFLDTEGEPYYQAGELDRGFVVLYAAENQQVMLEALKQNQTAIIIAGAAGAHVGAGTAVAAAGVQNPVLVSGQSFELWPTARLTGNNDIFVFAKGAKKKAVFEQRRMAVTGTYATPQNSDSARDFDIEYVQWKARHGVGAFLPLAAVKIDN